MRANVLALILGWPAAMALAVAVAGQGLSGRRRRTALNRALHELRRPLQALALAAAGERPLSAQLELAALALADLDQAVNGGAASARMKLARCRPLVEDAAVRWRGTASAAGGGITLSWDASDVWLFADPARLAQALDNLICNALEHGGARVAIEVSEVPGRVRLAFRDFGARVRPSSPPRAPGAARHGHGLKVVAAVAAAHRGRLALERGSGGTVAVLELPVAARKLAPRAA